MKCLAETEQLAATRCTRARLLASQLSEATCEDRQAGLCVASLWYGEGNGNWQLSGAGDALDAF